MVTASQHKRILNESVANPAKDLVLKEVLDLSDARYLQIRAIELLRTNLTMTGITDEESDDHLLQVITLLGFARGKLVGPSKATRS